MVMPCSRSADRPSVSSARSVTPARCTPARWSCSTALLSTSRRPINVLLPSSTLPQVMKRNAENWSFWAVTLAGLALAAMESIVIMVFLCKQGEGAGAVLARGCQSPRGAGFAGPPGGPLRGKAGLRSGPARGRVRSTRPSCAFPSRHRSSCRPCAWRRVRSRSRSGFPARCRWPWRPGSRPGRCR